MPTSTNNLIIIPFNFPLNWSADYEKQTAFELSKKNTVIAFLVGEGKSIKQFISNPIKVFQKHNTNLYFYRPPYILPFQRFNVISKINFYLASLMVQQIILLNHSWANKPRIYWSFSLQHSVLPNYFGKAYFKIYDGVDASFSSREDVARHWQSCEQQIIKQSDIILTNSTALFTRHKQKHPHVFQTPEGLFAKDVYARATYQEPDDLSIIPHPRIVFVGNINSRLHFSFIQNLARMTPAFQYVFVGNEDPQFDGLPGIDFYKELMKLKQAQNIHFLGGKPKHAIPSYIHYSDVGFVPYDTRLVFNKLSYPMKIQEFFYLGKPVLSSAIEEVKRLAPYATIYHSAKDAKQKLTMLLSQPWPENYKRAQRRIALSNSIEKKVSLVFALLKRHFPHRF